MFQYILFPGRHHILTNFQHNYLSRIVTDGKAVDINGQEVLIDKSPGIIWAVTSANHSNTRRNPLPANRREAAIEQFSNSMPAKSFVYHINDVGQTNRFADHTIKEIEVQSRGQHQLTPENTLVACSTPSVIELYEALGFKILPVELVDRESGQISTPRPWEIVLAMVDKGTEWRDSSSYKELVHPASQDILERYLLGDLIIEAFQDPLVGDEGDITKTRDYDTYRAAFEEGAQRKYEVVKDYLVPGRIVDIGCATGAIIKLLSDDSTFAESDLYGIEVTRRLFDICQQRKANDEFKNENVFFYQRNIVRGKLFPDNSIQTTLTFSLTHEIESYIGREALLRFLKELYEQTANGGVYINSDVVGPDDKDQMVLFLANTGDGKVIDQPYEVFESAEDLKTYLDSLSSYSRFLRFAQDFRKDENDGFKPEQVERDGKTYFLLRMADLADFLAKKDYTESWHSEMHERFCFWSFGDWQEALKSAGFIVDDTSHAYQNPWLIKNRFQPAGQIFIEKDNALIEHQQPVTNVLLVARKTA